MIIEVKSEEAMRALGARIGSVITGGMTIELVGDIGAGKTTFVKGLAKGLKIVDDVQSPTFTISRVYDARDGLQLFHYDFYRLSDAGIMADELRDAAQDPSVVTVVEWADTVRGVLPEARVVIDIVPSSELSRTLTLEGLPKELYDTLS